MGDDLFNQFFLLLLLFESLSNVLHQQLEVLVVFRGVGGGVGVPRNDGLGGSGRFVVIFYFLFHFFLYLFFVDNIIDLALTVTVNVILDINVS